jgi:leucyl aminopeptidase
MRVLVADAKLDSFKSEVIVVGMFSKEKSVPSSLKSVDDKLHGAISHVLKGKEFEGEFGQFFLISTIDKIPARNILLVGLGEQKDCTMEILRRIAGFSVKIVRDIFGVTSFATTLHELDVPKSSRDERAQVVAEGTVLGAYQYLKFKTVDKNKIKILEEVILVGNDVKDAVKKGVTLAECQCLVRDLANEPGSNLTPDALAKEAKKLEKLGVKVTVHDKKSIEKLGLKALLAVNRGSVIEPRFVIMEYNGGGKKKVALVGKGITFDSGGLDLKNADGMLTMKHDMCGAAVVIAAVKAAAELNLKTHLVGVFASTENMPGMDAYKPGDVVETYSGKTIEVLNTDAEGRVILSDALAYTEKVLKPDVMVDLATLTGAVTVALGSVCAGVMGRDDDLISKLIDAGQKTGERLWQLPFWREYHEQVKSDVADVRNLGLFAREAGSITAGAFLSAFVEKTPWAHIDIASVSWADVENGYTKKGGTGFGVRMLVKFLEDSR